MLNAPVPGMDPNAGAAPVSAPAPAPVQQYSGGGGGGGGGGGQPIYDTTSTPAPDTSAAPVDQTAAVAQLPPPPASSIPSWVLPTVGGVVALAGIGGLVWWLTHRQAAAVPAAAEAPKAA